MWNVYGGGGAKLEEWAIYLVGQPTDMLSIQ